jgi:hypothetical protein
MVQLMVINYTMLLNQDLKRETDTSLINVIQY